MDIQLIGFLNEGIQHCGRSPYAVSYIVHPRFKTMIRLFPSVFFIRISRSNPQLIKHAINMNQTAPLCCQYLDNGHSSGVTDTLKLPVCQVYHDN